MSLILAMCMFALSMSVSPGPVNIVTLSSGISYGVRKTMPFVSGAVIGFTLVLLSVGLGVGVIAAKNQFFLNILCFVGSGFIAYMGLNIARSGGKIETENKSRPTFIHGFAMQWLNPKAWIASLAGISAFNLADDINLMMVFVFLYFLLCWLGVGFWAVLGAKLSHYISSEVHIRWLNKIMGGFLIAIAIYLVAVQTILIS